MNSVIKVEHLTKQFKGQKAVNDLSFEVPAGTIFAFLGPNGAGKTTTIKTLMNIWPPSAGNAWILGKNTKQLSAEEFLRIGYVSENQQLPDWMSVEYFLTYCSKMYPRWDNNFCQTLLKQFEVPLKNKIKDLSRGMRMKLALVASLAYHPELLILDEPFSGLDPVVREELITGILELTASQSWTIFISSHDLEEVERLADAVAIIDHGELKLSEDIDSLLNRFREIEVTLKPNRETTHLPASWLSFQKIGSQARFVESQYKEGQSEGDIANTLPGSTIVQIRTLTLKEIFLALVRHFKMENL